MEKFTFKGFLLRLVAAFALVTLTVNPTGYSYLHWVIHVFPAVTALQAVAGVLLLIGWIIFVVATLRSIGPLGIGLLAILFAALVWLLSSMGWLSVKSMTTMGWIGVVTLSITLAVGVSWSLVSRRLTGQVDVDEADPQ